MRIEKVWELFNPSPKWLISKPKLSDDFSDFKCLSFCFVFFLVLILFPPLYFLIFILSKLVMFCFRFRF